MRRRTIAAAVLTFALIVVGAAVANDGRGHHKRHDGKGPWSASASSCGSGAVTGSQGPVLGPGTPPAGKGSYRFEIGSNGDTYRTLRSSTLRGKSLSSLTALSYSTYVTSFGTGGQAPYIDLLVDTTADGQPDDTLTFEPIYQTGGYSGDAVPNQGTVQLNTWQSWNALTGGWWSDDAGNSGPPLVTLSNYAADHPGTTITSIRLSTGCGGAAWANFVGYLDKVTIGVNGSSRTFDFEPARKHGKRKATVCHKGHTIKVDRRAVPAHERHGDSVGKCDTEKRDDDHKDHDD